MDSFEPVNLSPLSKEPIACGLPYGLTWDDLQPVLLDFDAKDSGRVQAFSAHDKQGLNGGENSCILSLQYPTGNKQLRTETVFIKQNADPKQAEADKYRYIHSQGVATPHLLAAFQKSETEVILLEYLPTIGINFSSTSEVNGLLHLVAKLNSIQHSSILFNRMPGLPQAEIDELVRAALVEIGQWWALFKIDVSRWFKAYQIAQEASKFMPLAVNHNELFFQQVGWTQRGDDRQLVLFDLETMALSPRFTDIATILYPLSIYAARDQVDLFQIYLARYFQLSHFELNMGEALRELKLLRITELCWSLPWLVGEARQQDAMDIHEGLSMAVNCLWNDLLSLGFS
jgi:hypothetical protein